MAISDSMPPSVRSPICWVCGRSVSGLQLSRGDQRDFCGQLLECSGLQVETEYFDYREAGRTISSTVSPGQPNTRHLCSSTG
jgi:hypothetical protein